MPYVCELMQYFMKKIIWLVLTVVSLVLSTYAFILGSKVMEKSQSAPPIYITYPGGYGELVEPAKPVSKSKKKNARNKTSN